MKILGLESSGKAAGLAIAEDGKIAAEFILNIGLTHSQTFLPLLDSMLTLGGFKLAEIDAIAVSVGPGSYTGLRIGIATAKGLVLPAEKAVVPVSTLEGLAHNLIDFKGRIFTLLFARSQELYYAQYQAEAGRLMEMEAPQVLLLTEVITRIKEVQASGQAVALAGDGFFQFEQELKTQLEPQSLFIPDRRRHQLSAASIALLGEQKLRAGDGIAGSQLVPVYLKKTQAERECGE